MDLGLWLWKQVPWVTSVCVVHGHILRNINLVQILLFYRFGIWEGIRYFLSTYYVLGALSICHVLWTSFEEGIFTTTTQIMKVRLEEFSSLGINPWSFWTPVLFCFSALSCASCEIKGRKTVFQGSVFVLLCSYEHMWTRAHIWDLGY